MEMRFTILENLPELFEAENREKAWEKLEDFLNNNIELKEVSEEEAREIEICLTRKKIYGLLGCRNCPIKCALSSNNLNEFENLNSEIPEDERPF